MALVDCNRRVGWYKHLVLVRKLKFELPYNLEALLGSRVRNEEAIAEDRLSPLA